MPTHNSSNHEHPPQLRQLIIYIAIILALGFAWAQKNTTPRRVATKAGVSDTTVRLSDIKPLPETTLRPTLKTDSLTDSIPAGLTTDSILSPTGKHNDSISDDRKGFSKIIREKVDIDNVINFSAKDSLVLAGQNNAYLYGDGNVDYGEFKLNSAEIRMELDSSTVYAAGVIDSVGELQGNPVFQQGGDEYESKGMKYNFKTERGYITDVITEQQDGFLIGSKAKKNPDGSFFLEDGFYTTCDDHEHPAPDQRRLR